MLSTTLFPRFEGAKELESSYQHLKAYYETSRKYGLTIHQMVRNFGETMIGVAGEWIQNWYKNNHVYSQQDDIFKCLNMWRKLQSEFLHRFSVKNLEDYVQTHIRDRKLREKESVIEYAKELEEYYKLLSEEPSESQKLDKFYDGLGDELASRMLVLNLKNIGEVEGQRRKVEIITKAARKVEELEKAVGEISRLLGMQKL